MAGGIPPIVDDIGVFAATVGGAGHVAAGESGGSKGSVPWPITRLCARVSGR